MRGRSDSTAMAVSVPIEPMGSAARLGHGLEDQPQLLVGVAEEPLAADHRGVLRREHGARRQVLELDLSGIEPLAVGVLGGQVGLDLVVVDDPARAGVHQEHPPRLQPALAHHLVGGHVDDPDLAGQHHQAVVGHPVAGRAQPVAVEDRADHRAVGEGHRRRAVPRLHQGGVVPVEGPAGRVHGPVVLPGLGDHHQHGVVAGAGRPGGAAPAPRRRRPSRWPRA